MTPEALKTLIDGDSTASTHALIGNDAACAARCTTIAPKLLKETRRSTLGIVVLYADPADGMTVLGTIQQIAAQNLPQSPLFALVLSYMQPHVSPEMLTDFADPNIRAALTAPVNAGGLGLSVEIAAPILEAAETPQTITADQVSTAMAPSRAGS